MFECQQAGHWSHASEISLKPYHLSLVLIINSFATAYKDFLEFVFAGESRHLVGEDDGMLWAATTPPLGTGPVRVLPFRRHFEARKRRD